MKQVYIMVLILAILILMVIFTGCAYTRTSPFFSPLITIEGSGNGNDVKVPVIP